MGLAAMYAQAAHGHHWGPTHLFTLGAPLSTQGEAGYTAGQRERLSQIHARLVEARRELDALIGDAYLRPRANIVPVHFLDLASAVEKLRWAEKEWRELDREMTEDRSAADLVEVVHAET